MNRRHALTTGLTLTVGAALAAWLPGRSVARAMPLDIEAALQQSRCSSAPRSTNVPVAMTGDRLSFAGTRLFKEGFLDELGELYRRSTGRSIEVLGGGCDDGLAAVRQRKAVIGGLCCPLEGGPAAGLQHVTVAQDLKVVVAHPDVSVGNLRWQALVSLLTGGIHNWKAVGGRDQSVALVLHDHCPDYVEPARRMLLGQRLNWSRDALVVKTDQKHLDTVARFESAVGINSWILAEPYVRSGRLKVLSVDGVAPTVAHAAARRYRLVGPMNMIFDATSARTVAPFFSFLFSEAGRHVIGRRLVPLAR